MILALSLAQQHVIACHARQLLDLMLQPTPVPRGDVLAWIVILGNLLLAAGEPPPVAGAAAPQPRRRGRRR